MPELKVQPPPPPVPNPYPGMDPNLLKLENILWVEVNPGHSLRSYGYSSDNDGRENIVAWRQSIVGKDKCPTSPEPFPDTDSNGNTCRILSVGPEGGNSGQTGWGSLYYVAIYPGGTALILPSKKAYNDHHGTKLSHFTLATLAAWPAGESRQYNTRGSAATNITDTMWQRATFQGYISPPSDSFSANMHSSRIRTSKKVEANLKKSRKLKSAVWPYSEKEHWFRIMSGALQVNNTNMTKILAGNKAYGISHKDERTVRKNFPVFPTCAAFKQARRFLESISTKKNDKADRDQHSPTVTTTSCTDWDPLKSAKQDVTSKRYSSSAANDSMFSTPYAIVKTSMMLGCVPLIEEDGSIADFREVDAEYVSNLRDTTPIDKSVVGVWRGEQASYSGRRADTHYHPSVSNGLGIDNLTHMYLILLNEARLLSNDDLVRWCEHQRLILTKEDFNTKLILSHEYSVYGYQLTDSLAYTCVIWNQALPQEEN